MEHTTMTMKTQEGDKLLQALKVRFEKNMQRHEGTKWAEVQARLEANPAALKSLREMEATGGEPDVIGNDAGSGHYTFCDCSAESPAGRRSVKRARCGRASSASVFAAGVCSRSAR